jgi:hypothetical protein
MPLLHINHGAWLLVTARLTAVYVAGTAEASCTLALDPGLSGLKGAKRDAGRASGTSGRCDA